MYDKEKKYQYSLLSRFISILFLGVFGLIFFINLKITNNKSNKIYDDLLYIFSLYTFEILLLVFILICISYSIYKSILQPFIKLSKSAMSISNGDLDARIPILYSNEGASLALALEKIKDHMKVKNQLIKEVLALRNKLATADLRLENKVKERINELENKLKIKTELFDHLNHEIILPIQGIYNISDNIVKFFTDIDDLVKREHIKQISYTAKRLSNKIDDLLDLSKFSKSSMQLSLTKFELTELTQEVIDECQIMYGHQKKINFNFNNEKKTFITADKSRIAKLLFHLFLNAIKFSPYKGDIAVNILPTKINIGSSHYEAIHLLVSDRGSGLDEEEISTLFAPFSQGKNFVKKTGGFGLGLSICKQITIAHNGKIWANNNKDGGANFNFIIPIIQPKSKSKEENKPSAIDLHYNIPNILMIDDEDICLNSMELLLYNSKYNLIKANTGTSGLKYLRKHYKSIKLIMLDLMMPDMYGLNVLAEIKKSPKLNSIPVVLQTGTFDEDEVVKAFDMGVNSFVRKPYNKEDVLAEIEKSLITNSNKNSVN